MIAALLTWPVIQSAAPDCAAASREETPRAAGYSETDGRTARGAAAEKAPVS